MKDSKKIDPSKVIKTLPRIVKESFPKEEPKRETLEDACERIKKELDYSEFDYTSFKLGSKWRAEITCKHSYTLTDEQGHRVIKCGKCNDTQPI
jgi:hypothetical protein